METLFIGKNSLFLHEVESTNTYAMNMLRNVNAVEGTVIYTDNQTNGKGQRGATWTSKIAQNITVSILLKPAFLDINHSFYLSKISALAVYDLLTDILSPSQYDIKIKWPNDILVNRKKIAGILIENNLTAQFIQNAVIGIGFNVNQDDFFEFERTATSLKLLLNKELDRSALMQILFSKLEKWYLILRQQKFDLINDSYLSNLFGLGDIFEFQEQAKAIFKAKTIGVTNQGKLLLELENEQLAEFDVKEIRYLM